MDHLSLLIKGILERYHAKIKGIPYLNSEVRPKVRDSCTKTAVPLFYLCAITTRIRGFLSLICESCEKVRNPYP